MSDKALTFEDFILDDYDFNLLTDWDLMDLWEWVEMDDFSDIIQQHPKEMAKKPNSTPQPQQSQQKQQPPPQPSYGQQASSQHSSPQQTSSNSSLQNDDDFDFDFDDDDDASPAPITPSADTNKASPLPSPTKHLAPASPPSAAIDTPQASLSSAQNTQNDDDFDFDFDFDDDEDNHSDFNFDDAVPNVTSQNTPSPPASTPTAHTQAKTTSSPPISHTQAKASVPNPQPVSPPPVPQNYQTTENDDDDTDFDFNFDDEEEDENAQEETDFDFNFDDDEDEREEENSEQNENEDDFDFNFDDDDDDSEEANYDFDFTDENAEGIGSGGFQKKQHNDPNSNRFIQTSIGVLDSQSDDILEHLQELEFDEFLKVLQENPHVYDKIMTTGTWSEEEMEFLHSIEPLIRDAKKIQEARGKKNDNASSSSPSPQTPPKSKFDTRIYQSAEEMYKQLCLKASQFATTKGQQKVKHLPDNLAQQWNKDSEEKQANRVSHHLGTTLKVAPKAPPPVMQELTPPKGTTARPIPYLGINEAKFNEINHIFLHELYAMSQSLTPEALAYVRADGIRFGTEFITFLMNKYGSKILFLYRTQIKNDILSHKIFATHLSYITAHLQPDNPEYYTMGFFKSIVDMIDKNGLNI